MITLYLRELLPTHNEHLITLHLHVSYLVVPVGTISCCSWTQGEVGR